jgi:carbon storage regulator
MLVISRKRNEAVIIGDGIEVRILRVGRDGVRLGVTAPQEVTVHRQEIYQMVGAANLSAARGLPGSVAKLAERLRKQTSSEAALPTIETEPLTAQPRQP